MRNFRYLLTVTALLVGFFELLRLGLLLRYWGVTTDIPAGILFKSFLVGFRFDLTITGYILSLPVLVGMLPGVGWSDARLWRRISTIYISVLASVAFFMNIADLEFLGEFNTRLNHIALDWSDTPWMSLKMTWENVPLPLYLGLWAVVSALFIYLLTKVNYKLLKDVPREPVWRRWAIYVLSLGLTFLAIRGRIEEKSPINYSIAYFSSYHFANQLALNSVFTFVRDAILDRGARQEAAAVAAVMSADDAYRAVQKSLSIDPAGLIGDSPLAHRCGEGESRNYNVVVVIAESFGSNFIKSCGGSEDFAPEFDRIAQDGLLFTQFFANGAHTYSGMFSTVTGMPTTPGRPIMKISEGQQEFGGLASVLKRRGYATRCYLPHDPIFDNKQGFLLQNGYQRVVGLFDYPQEEKLSTVGVPDEVMYDYALNDFETLPRPFCALLQTGSSHGPFRVPDRPHRKPDPGQRQYDRINAFLYTDWALAQFYDQIKTSDYTDSTIFVVVADNGTTWNARLEMDLSTYRIPLLIVAPGLQPDVRTEIGSLKDVTATVMDLLGGDWINATLGLSMLTRPPGRAFFVEGNQIAVVDYRHYLMTRKDGSLQLFSYPELEVQTDHPAIVSELQTYAQTYLAAAHYLIFDRKVGLP